MMPTHAPIDRKAPVERTWLDEHSWVDVVRGFAHDTDATFERLVNEVAWTQNRQIGLRGRRRSQHGVNRWRDREARRALELRATTRVVRVAMAAAAHGRRARARRCHGRR
jgi:hypothetical protein